MKGRLTPKDCAARFTSAKAHGMRCQPNQNRKPSKTKTGHGEHFFRLHKATPRLVKAPSVLSRARIST
jgi:hypothetical protein